MLRHEPSPAVKAQALGILAVIFDAAPEAVWEFPRKAELAEVIPHRAGPPLALLCPPTEAKMHQNWTSASCHRSTLQSNV